MTLSFAEASRALAQVNIHTAEFEAACAERMRDMQDELDGVDSSLRAVLMHEKHVKLPDGSYLYMKECQSTRALNETRIARALDALTEEQLKEVMRENTQWTPWRVILEALSDNLDSECVVVTKAPTIVKKAPSLTVQWKPASQNIATQASRFQELRKSLTAIRKHRTVGKRRFAAVQSVAEPIVQSYLESHRVDKQLVQFGGTAAPQIALPPFPVVPELPGLTINEPVAAETTTTIIDDGLALDGQKVMFSTRTYTSRGKAPSLSTFIDAMPTSLTKFNAMTLQQVQNSKPEILKALINLYKNQFITEQGSVKKRLVCKTL
jgi:hypothetical protein